MAEALDNYADIELDEDSLLELFNKAANHIKTLASKLDSTQLLELYSHYKQATEGPCNIPKPRFYEVQAKQKWEAWNSLGSLSQDEAKNIYIHLVYSLDPEFEKNDTSPSWITVSSLQNNEDSLSDDEKTIFDHIKDGDFKNFVSKLDNLNQIDSDGMGLIHWAADRGDLRILKHLINSKANLNLLDSEGQTALHYAVSCDHFDCVKLLVDSGADVNLKDSDGNLAIDLTNNSDVTLLLSK